MADAITVPAIFDRTFALLRANPLPALLSLAAMAGPAAAIDALLLPDQTMRFFFVPSLIAIFCEFVVTRRLLRRRGVTLPAASIGAFVGALILMGLGIGLGFVLLILPGLYLWARWSITIPLILGEGASAGEAFTQSGVRTAKYVGPILAALVLANLGVAGSLAIGVFLYPDYDPAPIGLAIALNLLSFGAQILTWHCGVAIYALTARPEADTLEEIFA
jgi:hypothetical protein